MSDSILIRIQKLLNMTEARGATPEEAATAAAKAQALLFEHNLTMAQVESVQGKPIGEDIDKHIYDMVHGKDQSMAWRKVLLHIVTRYNFCRCIASVDGLDRRTAIIGKKSNVDVAIYIYENTQRQIHDMAKEYQRLQTQNKSMFYTSFCAGACTTIKDRLKALQEQQMAANPQSNALVVVSHQQLSAVVQKHFPRLSQGKGVKVNRADGFELGKREGHRVSLNKGLTSTSSPTGAIRQIGGN